jgi:hypothetical protein
LFLVDTNTVLMREVERMDEKARRSLVGRLLGDPSVNIQTSDATNAYDNSFGSAILTGIEIPSLGC